MRPSLIFIISLVVIVLSYQVSFHSPVFQVITSFQISRGRIHCTNFSCGPKYINSLHCLSYFIAKVKVPYYHEPLIVSKRECVNRSIEGDSSVRVGSTNLSYERITFDPFQGVWQSTQLGHFIQSSFGVMSLRANVSFLCGIVLSYTLYLWLP